MPTLASKQSRHQIRRPTAKDDYKVIFTDANLRTHHGGRVLKLEYHKSPQVTVLRCSGRIVQGDGADTLLRAIMSEDKRHILIDLIEVTAIDAAGLGALAELERWA